MDNNLIFKYLQATTNLYGIVPPEKVVEIYNQQNKDKIDLKDLVQYSDQSYSFFEYFEGYFAHDALFVGDGLWEVEIEQSGKPYYVPPKQELLKYTDDTYIEKPPEYWRLYNYIAKNITDAPEMLEDLMEDIHLTCALDFSIDSAMDEFNRRNIEFESEAQAIETIQLIVGLANNTRTWENRGHTPNEIFNLVEKPALMPLPKDQWPGFDDMAPLGGIGKVASGKIGRNDPCPCGSGKKYKRCCIDMPKPRTRHWSYYEVDAMDSEEIIQNLKNMGITIDKERFLRDVERCRRAQDISEGWFQEFEVKAQGWDEDFPWFAAWVLWERMAPAGNVPLEYISDLYNEGVDYFIADDYENGCDVWLKVWENLKIKFQKWDCYDLDELNQWFRGMFFVSNLIEDLDMHLYSAGMRNKSYFQKRIDYNREFLALFLQADDDTIGHRRRAVAESYARLGDHAKAESEFEKITQDRPHDPWGYIAWGDIYYSEYLGNVDYDKAKGLYHKALAVSTDKDDIMVVQERLEDLDGKMD